MASEKQQSTDGGEQLVDLGATHVSASDEESVKGGFDPLLTTRSQEPPDPSKTRSVEPPDPALPPGPSRSWSTR